MVVRCIVDSDIVVSLHLLHVIAYLNAVHHVVGRLFLHVILRAISLHEGCQSLGLPFLQLHVEGLFLGNCFEELIDLHILHLKLTLLKSSLGPLGLALDLGGGHDEFDVLFVVVEFLFQIVDLLNKLDVLLHETLVHFFMGLVGLCLGVTQVVNIRLQVLTDLLEFESAVVIVLLLVLDLLRHVLLVKSDDGLLQLLVVADVVKCDVNLVFEMLLLLILLFKDLLEATILSNQASHSHTQIFDNQGQVVEHTLEMGLLLLHFVSLVLQFFNRGSTGSNISLKLLDFVVEHKFEFFELLGLLLQIFDTLLLVPDGGFTLRQLESLRGNIGLELVVGGD